MAELQEVFSRIQENKRQQKEIKRAYREALEQSVAYHEVAEQFKVLKEKKKSLETQIRQDFASEFNKLEACQDDMKSDAMILSDLAINKVMQGETIKVTDENNNNYEPIFSVKFKKIT
jgi:dGTP triphosphohydrolase